MLIQFLPELGSEFNFLHSSFVGWLKAPCYEESFCLLVWPGKLAVSASQRALNLKSSPFLPRLACQQATSGRSIFSLADPRFSRRANSWCPIVDCVFSLPLSFSSVLFRHPTDLLNSSGRERISVVIPSSGGAADQTIILKMKLNDPGSQVAGGISEH